MKDCVKAFRKDDWKSLRKYLSEIYEDEEVGKVKQVLEMVQVLKKMIGQGIVVEVTDKKDVREALKFTGLDKDEAVVVGMGHEAEFLTVFGPIAFVSYYEDPEKQKGCRYQLYHELWHVRQAYYPLTDFFYSETVPDLFTNEEITNPKISMLFNLHLYLEMDFKNDPKAMAFGPLVREYMHEQAKDLEIVYLELKEKIGAREAQEVLLNCVDFDEAIAKCFELL